MQRIYLNQNCTQWALVDDCDYAYFCKWKWNGKKSKSGGIYARRATGGSYRSTGRTPVITIYLHREILKRKKEKQGRRRIGGHIDGNTLNCTRENLEWTTKKKNTVTCGGRRAFSVCLHEERIAA